MPKQLEEQKNETIKLNLSSLSYIGSLKRKLSHNEVSLQFTDDSAQFLEEKLATNQTIMQRVEEDFKGL